MTKRSSTPISADARSLPDAAYTSTEFFEAETAHVHRRSRFFAGPGRHSWCEALVEPIDGWVMDRIPEALRPL